MKMEILEIETDESKIYKELLEQYKTNPELQVILDEPIFHSGMILAGDFRLITMLNRAIELDNIEVYLAKDVDNGVFLWAIGRFIDDGKISIYPLLKDPSEELQLATRNILIKRGFVKEADLKSNQEK